MNRDRITWLDIAKGIGMIAVIIDHAIIFPSPITQYMDSFHMPLFFMLSGYIYAMRPYAAFRDLFRRKLRTLAVPYLFFAVLSYFWWLFEWRLGEHADIPVWKPIVGTFLAIRNTDWTSHTGALWFLVCLLMTELSFYFLLKACRHRHLYLLGAVAGLAVVGGLYHELVNVSLLLNLDAVPVVVPFFGLGYLFHEHRAIVGRVGKLGLLFALFPLSAALALWNNDVDILQNQYGNVGLFYLAAVSAGAAAVLVSMKLGRNAVLEYIGRHSLIILAVNPFILALIRRTVHLPSGMNDAELILAGIGYLAVVLLLSVPAIFVLTNYLPFVLGRGRPSPGRSLNELPLAQGEKQS